MKQQIAALAESEEERQLLIRVCDRMERARLRETAAVSAFLTLREQALVRQLLPFCGFWGGMEGAERAVAYYLPEDLPFECVTEAITALRAEFYDENALNHRDMLGALMGAGIKREAVGDICVSTRSCDFFVLTELTRYLLDNLNQAGRQHLRLHEIDEVLRPAQRTKEQRVSVSALRLDSVTAAGFHLSRGDAAEAVRGGRVALNSLTCLKPDRAVSEGDEISVRGLGKLRVLELGGLSRRGRQSVLVGIYL